MLCVTVRKSPWLQEIRMLDPERDCRRIVFLDTFLEFPFDTTRALELAFFKTLPRRASPSSSTRPTSSRSAARSATTTPTC
jgi:hypothetical protein